MKKLKKVYCSSCNQYITVEDDIFFCPKCAWMLETIKENENIENFIFTKYEKGYSIDIKEGVELNGEIEIPVSYKKRNVLRIVSRAFYNQKNITLIRIPISVTKIGKEVFHYCKSLKSIKFEDPDNWYIPGQRHFCLDDSLENVNDFHQYTYYTWEKEKSLE